MVESSVLNYLSNHYKSNVSQNFGWIERKFEIIKLQIYCHNIFAVNIRWLNISKFNHVKEIAHVSILLAFLWALFSISALLKKPSILSRAFYCSKLTFNGLERKNKMVWVYYVTWHKVTYWQYEFYKVDITKEILEGGSLH